MHSDVFGERGSEGVVSHGECSGTPGLLLGLMEAGGSASRAEVAGRSVVVEHSGTASLEKN